MDTTTAMTPKNLQYFDRFKAAKMELVSAAGGPIDLGNQIVVTGKKGQAAMPIYDPADLGGIVATLKRVTGKVQEVVFLADTYSATATPGAAASPKDRFEAGDDQTTEALMALVCDGQSAISCFWPYRYDAEGFIVANGDTVTRTVNGGQLAKSIMRLF